MNILAIDPAVTVLGWASGSPAHGGTIINYGTLVSGARRGGERLAFLRDQLRSAVEQAQLVVLEGYGFATQRGHSARQLGELGGVLRLMCYDAGDVPYVEVPPATLKLFATGKGDAPKSWMKQRARSRLKYDGDNHNEADALFLLATALHVYGAPQFHVDEAHTAGLRKIDWPRVGAWTPANLDAQLAFG